MLKPLRQISSALLLKNPWWEYRKDSYEKPNGSEGEFHFVHTAGSVMVIPLTDEGNIIAVRLFRYLNQREGIEFVGGGIKPGKTAEQSAHEELLEEAGLVAATMTKIGEFNPMNGVTDEICNIFLAESLKKAQAMPEDSEEFEVIEISQGDFSKHIGNGQIWDGMTLAAYSLFEHRN
ncbi:MAG: NUDIX hydrolase [Ignavibacteriota bacterium]